MYAPRVTPAFRDHRRVGGGLTVPANRRARPRNLDAGLARPAVSVPGWVCQSVRCGRGLLRHVSEPFCRAIVVFKRFNAEFIAIILRAAEERVMDQDISILGACCGAVVSFLLGGVWCSRFRSRRDPAREAA